MKILTSRKGFTLIELLVVIGILAVLAAIAIPSVAGLIDRANVSADKTNSNEMTNAMERFASEYELFCQDIASGTFDKGNMDAAQGRVYNVLGIEDRAGIELVEIGADEPVDDDDIAIYRDTKYPANAKTAQLIVQNYTKTSSSTFEPKQSDMHYWYSPDCGVIVYAEPDAGLTPENVQNKLNAQVVSGMDAKGNPLDENTEWIDLTLNASLNNNNATQTSFTKWVPTTWKGLTSFSGRNIWTDGKNIYYSWASNQYVLSGDTWVCKTWNGLREIDGSKIWSDGTNIYYSNESDQYVLNGDTWTVKTWNGISDMRNFEGHDMWTDGTKFYFSYANSHYMLNGDTWTRITWEGLTNFAGNMVWTDGSKTFYSTDYVLNGNTWERITWENEPLYFYGSHVWTDGTNLYHSYTYQEGNHVLNGNTWEEKTWEGLTSFFGSGVWTDGSNIYYSNGTDQYILTK